MLSFICLYVESTNLLSSNVAEFVMLGLIIKLLFVFANFVLSRVCS